MHILAIDLGKFRSVAGDYDTSTAQHTFTTVRTTPQALHDLFAARSPDRVVIGIPSDPPIQKPAARATVAARCRSRLTCRIRRTPSRTRLAPHEYQPFAPVR